MDNTNYHFFNLNDILNSLTGGSDSYANRPLHQRPAPPSPPPERNLEEEIAARKARIAEEQRALEEAEKEFEKQKNKIRYVADDEKIEMLVPREKLIKMIQSLTKVVQENKDAKTYRVTINL